MAFVLWTLTMSFLNINQKYLFLRDRAQGWTPKKPELILDLDIKIKTSILVYNLFDKRDKTPFFYTRNAQFCHPIYYLQFSVGLYFQFFFE